MLREGGRGREVEGEQKSEQGTKREREQRGEREEWVTKSESKNQNPYFSTLALCFVYFLFSFGSIMEYPVCRAADTAVLYGIRDNCVRLWLSVALTWEILNLSSVQLLLQAYLHCDYFFKSQQFILFSSATKLACFYMLAFLHVRLLFYFVWGRKTWLAKLELWISPSWYFISVCSVSFSLSLYLPPSHCLHLSLSLCL